MAAQVTVAAQAHDVGRQLVAEISVMQMMQIERNRLMAGLAASSSRLNPNPDDVVDRAMQSARTPRARGPVRGRTGQEVVYLARG